MYTQSQLVTMAMEAPLFLDRLELISDGYKNGMARKDRPYGLVLVARIEIGGRCTHIEEVVKEKKVEKAKKKTPVVLSSSKEEEKDSEDVLA